MANIAFLLNQFPIGGVERVTMNIIPSLTYDKGHRVFIFVHELHEEQLPAMELPVTYIHLPYKAWVKHNEEAVVKGIKEHGIDVLFLPVICPNYLFNIKKLRVCKVCFVLHSMPFYELREIENRILKGVQSRRRLSLKQFVDRLKLRWGVYDFKIRHRYKKRYKELDAFGVLNDCYGEEIAKQIGVKYSDSKFFALPNPLLPVADTVEEVERKKRIIFMGRLSHMDKRVDRLLDVWKIVYKRFSEWELFIVGDGPEKEYLQRYVIENGLSRVTFVPFTSTPELYYKGSEILCLTSDFEGCPMALLEAQQFGCATIAFDCCYGVRDIISRNWENGVRVPNGEIESYAKALARLMSEDELRCKIQRNGVENIKRFSIEKSVERYEMLIKNLTDFYK